MQFEAKQEFLNPLGVVQGGFVAAMLDDTLGPALVCTLPPGQFAPTIELKVNFIRPAQLGILIGEGRVVVRGGTIGFLAGELRAWVASRLAAFKIPVRVVLWRDMLPAIRPARSSRTN